MIAVTVSSQEVRCDLGSFLGITEKPYYYSITFTMSTLMKPMIVFSGIYVYFDYLNIFLNNLFLRIP